MSTWNPVYQEKCQATNERWRQEQIGNLTEHYEWCKEALKGCISAYRLTGLELITNMNQAKKWVKQHFGKKFKKNIFDEVDRQVGSLINYTISESTAKSPSLNSGCKINAKTKKVENTETPSTPSRKRSRLSSPETSPVQSHTPKRSKTLSYAEKANSPPSRTNTGKSKYTPAVTKFPALKPDQRGTQIHSVWEVPKITKDILVLGDSNLARISFVNNRNAQVVSYSGLKLDLLLRLLQNFKFGPKSDNPGRTPSQVVFSVGINDKELKDSTNEINIRKVMNEARRQFPGSKISFCLISFDKKLSSNHKKTLDNLNDAIKALCDKEELNCIPKVAERKFETVSKDPIHWTENCANATIEHIITHLN